jgi:hypothetical protein
LENADESNDDGEIDIDIFQISAIETLGVEEWESEEHERCAIWVQGKKFKVYSTLKEIHRLLKENRKDKL